MGVRNWEFLKPWQVEGALVQLFSSRCSLIFHQQRSPHIRGRFTYLGSHIVTRYRRKVGEPWVFCTQCWCRKYRREFFCRLAFGGEYTQILICDLFVDFRFVVLRYIQMCTTSLWLNNSQYGKTQDDRGSERHDPTYQTGSTKINRVNLIDFSAKTLIFTLI